jgi:hypothetical protein
LNTIKNQMCEYGICYALSFKGAGIFNSGTLNLDHSVVDSNQGDAEDALGGGIYNSGIASLTDSVVSGSYGAWGRFHGLIGSGLYNDASSEMTLLRSRIGPNFSMAAPGIVNSGTMTLKSSTVSGNSGWGGGGITNRGGLNLHESNVIYNSTGVGGLGGITNSGSLSLVRSTVAGNSSENQAGVYNSGPLSLVNSTIAGNDSFFLGGSGLNSSGSGEVIASTITGNNSWHGTTGGVQISGINGIVVKGSVLAGNAVQGNDGFFLADCSGPINSHGDNLVGAPANCPGLTNDDILGTDWTQVLEATVSGFPFALEPLLASNGGPTNTVALQTDSPAIDQIAPEACVDSQGNPLLADQRGISRPQGPACDVGAFEFAQPRGEGFWAHQCRNNGYIQIDSAQLEALFATVADSSAVFPEFGSIDCAALDPTIPQNDLRARAQQELLATWLNLETGRLTRGRPIDLPNLTTARTVGEALGSLELTLCDPDATRNELGNAKSLAQALNNGIDDMELATTETSISLLPGSSRTINLGLVNMSPTNRNYSLLASGPWAVRLSTSRVNALASGDVAQITATIIAPIASQTATAPIRFTATDLGAAGLSREAIIIFKLAPASTSEPKKKLTQVD